MKPKKHHKKRILFATLAALLLFFLTPPSKFLISITVMQIYSHLCEKGSIPDKENISVHIPGGNITAKRDWYPFVMTFQDNKGFQQFTGNDTVSLTIMYNFPAFSLTRGCSLLYDTQSPYYNSFYGAYFVQKEGTPYGFTTQPDGTPQVDYPSISQVPQFDFQTLVLHEFGLTSKNAVFDWDITDTKENISYAGHNDFVQIDALLTVNGASHRKNEFQTSYLQYGSPNYPCDKALAPVTMYGRIYCRYFEEWDSSVFFYIIAADKTVLEDCDTQILSKSTLAPA